MPEIAIGKRWYIYAYQSINIFLAIYTYTQIYIMPANNTPSVVCFRKGPEGAASERKFSFSLCFHIPAFNVKSIQFSLRPR